MNQIIEFISFDEINEDTLKLAAKVNSHISVCPACRSKIRSIQGILDRMLDYEPPAADGFSEIVIDPDIRAEIAKFYK